MTRCSMGLYMFITNRGAFLVFMAFFFLRFSVSPFSTFSSCVTPPPKSSAGNWNKVWLLFVASNTNTFGWVQMKIPACIAKESSRDTTIHYPYFTSYHFQLFIGYICCSLVPSVIFLTSMRFKSLLFLGIESIYWQNHASLISCCSTKPGIRKETIDVRVAHTQWMSKESVWLQRACQEPTLLTWWLLPRRRTVLLIFQATAKSAFQVVQNGLLAGQTNRPTWVHLIVCKKLFTIIWRGSGNLLYSTI